MVSGNPQRWFAIGVRVWRAGELKGFGNYFHQTTMSGVTGIDSGENVLSATTSSQPENDGIRHECVGFVAELVNGRKARAGADDTKQASAQLCQRSNCARRNPTHHSSARDGAGKTTQILGKTGHTANDVYHLSTRTHGIRPGSTILLFVISGNKNPMQHSMASPCSPSRAHPTVGRIECDSHNWMRRRSRSSHCIQVASPRVCLIPTQEWVKQ